MNIALSAVIIFILLLPPIAFYLSFSFGLFPRANPKIGLLEGLMVSAIFSVILHFIAITILGGDIRFDILALLMGGDLKAFGASVSNQHFRQMFKEFVLYNFSLVLLMALLGIFLRRLVDLRGWHSKTEIFRVYNRWWYFFRGYKADGTEPGKPLLFDIVYVDALVNTNAGSMIYSGYLLDFVCNGEILDRIYLAEAGKREFKVNAMNERGNILINQTGNPKDIDSQALSIPYHSVVNLNLRFIEIPSELKELIIKSQIERP